jgi:hypothetical protein
MANFVLAEDAIVGWDWELDITGANDSTTNINEDDVLTKLVARLAVVETRLKGEKFIKLLNNPYLYKQTF